MSGATPSGSVLWPEMRQYCRSVSFTWPPLGTGTRICTVPLPKVVVPTTTPMP